jgi:citrate lyase synthetase
MDEYSLDVKDLLERNVDERTLELVKYLNHISFEHIFDFLDCCYRISNQNDFWCQVLFLGVYGIDEVTYPVFTKSTEKNGFSKHIITNLDKRQLINTIIHLCIYYPCKYEYFFRILNSKKASDVANTRNILNIPFFRIKEYAKINSD